MRFKLFREHGALNSKPIFDAFEQGLKNLGHESVNSNYDVSVIWSVLWNGRMLKNRSVYHEERSKNKPVIIIEVGNLKRNDTWRICLNHINGQGLFGNDNDLDESRPSKLGVHLHNPKNNRQPEILIATQHPKSLQWENMPTMQQWVENTVKEIRKFSDKKVVIRPHPRATFQLNNNDKSISIQRPVPVKGSYDDFDINYNYHCVINHNSGPAVQAAIHGVPIICNSTSLAYPVSSNFEQIENIYLPDREEWFLKLTHTEWTVDEIRKGIPLKRLESLIK
jgi:hypothetical protein